MKKTITLLFSLLLSLSIWAQSPEKVSYQAVIRNAQNELVANTQIGLQISILEGSINGTTVYSEIQSVTTNTNGLISVEIGTGSTSDNFSDINWSEGSYFVQTEVDINGGSNYTITGVSQLLSVPYALHAKVAESVVGGITETDPMFSEWDKSTGITISENQVTGLAYFTNADEADPVYAESAAAKITTNDIAKWNSGNVTDAETDPFFNVSPAANITSTHLSKLNNLIGVNTGDQDLSNLALQTALEDTAAAIRSSISTQSGSGIINETDPVYTASEAANITAADIINLANLSGTNTGDQDLSALASITLLNDSLAALRAAIPVNNGSGGVETDPVYNASEAANITATDITNLGNLSGTNTGDQDLSTLATQTALGDSITLIRNEIPDVSSFLSAETDPVYTTSEAANITAADITNLGNLSGTNTGDQDLSNLATKVNVLELDNTQVFTPDADYEPATKLYVDLLEHKYTLLEIRVQLLEGKSLADLILGGSELEDLVELGFSESELYNAGATASELIALGYTTAELLAIPIPLSELLSAGVTVADLLANGEAASDLYAAGATFAELYAAGIQVDELYNTIGATITELLALNITPLSIMNVGADSTQFIGEFYKGGVIFYILSDGSGYVSAITDVSNSATWGCERKKLEGADGQAIGTGYQNTLDILADCSDTDNAATLCSNYSITVNGATYSDWFLPSIYELREMQKNITVIDSTSFANGGTALDPYYYWSSSENGIVNVYVQTFTSGNVYVMSKDKTNYNTRPISSF